jgi:hypothetical protein
VCINSRRPIDMYSVRGFSAGRSRIPHYQKALKSVLRDEETWHKLLAFFSGLTLMSSHAYSVGTAVL